MCRSIQATEYLHETETFTIRIFGTRTRVSGKLDTDHWNPISHKNLFYRQSWGMV